MFDASGLLDDAPELRARLRHDGYVLVRDVLPVSEVDGVAKSVRSHLAAAGHTDPAGRPRGRPLEEEDADHLRVYRSIQSDEGLHRLAHHGSLVSVAAALLGLGHDDLLVHPRKIVRLTFPDNAFGTTPPHQDYPLIQGASDVLTMWIPLTDCPTRMGGLKVLQGSHHNGIITATPREAVGKIGVDVADDDPRWVRSDFSAGDVLVFHSLTVHGAVPNRSDRVRLSADFRYQDRKAPIVKDSLHPHYHPALPDWPELTATWSTTRWSDSPEGLDIVDYRLPTEPLLPPPSAFVDVGDQPRRALDLA